MTEKITNDGNEVGNTPFQCLRKQKKFLFSPSSQSSFLTVGRKRLSSIKEILKLSEFIFSVVFYLFYIFNIISNS